MILFDHSVPALQEIERLRELNLQAEQEKVNAVAHVRSEAKEEIVKMRDKIQEVIEKLGITISIWATDTVIDPTLLYIPTDGPYSK